MILGPKDAIPTGRQRHSTCVAGWMVPGFTIMQEDNLHQAVQELGAFPQILCPVVGPQY